MKSVTGRTVVEASVEANGSTVVKVYRSGQCVHDFSIGREQDIPGGCRLEKNGDVVDVIDGDTGITVKSIPIE